MIIKGTVIGCQIFRSGACQLFVSSHSSDGEKIREQGQIVRCLWQGKGTYNFDAPPNLVGANVIAFVGRNESGIIDIQLQKGGVN